MAYPAERIKSGAGIGLGDAPGAVRRETRRGIWASVARLARTPIRRKLVAALSGVELEGDRIVLAFEPRAGRPARIEDRVRLARPGELATVYGVGRLIRLLRAARMRVPRDPYALALDRARALELLRKCLGTEVLLHVDRRLKRVLTLWTESGVERVDDLVDYAEDADFLSVRGRGGGAPLRISKRDLVRYETGAEDAYVVVSIESVRA